VIRKVLFLWNRPAWVHCTPHTSRDNI
jgi:hypothetical protein